jgi:uncharacterized membrane protein YhaH (DUF805 family)
LIKEYRTNHLKRFAFLLILLIISYIPNIAIVYIRFRDTAQNGNWVPTPEGIESVYNIIWKFTNMPINAVISILILVTGCLFWIFSKKPKRHKNQINTIIIWFFTPLIGLFTISYFIPMFVDRYLIFISMGFYLLLIIFIDYLIIKRWIKLSAMSLLAVLFMFTFTPQLEQKSDISKAVEKIRILKTKTTDVIVCPQHYLFNFTYYYDLNLFKLAENNLVKSDFIYAKIQKALGIENVYGINYFENYEYTVSLDKRKEYNKRAYLKRKENLEKN